MPMLVFNIITMPYFVEEICYDDDDDDDDDDDVDGGSDSDGGDNDDGDVAEKLSASHIFQ